MNALKLLGVVAMLSLVQLGCSGAQQCDKESDPNCDKTTGTGSSSSSSSGMSGETVGDVGGPCYFNGTCNLGSACVAAVCQLDPSAGTLNHSCLPNLSCGTGLDCVGGMCKTPGGSSSSSSSSSSTSGGSSSGGGVEAGDEGGHCYANGTCNAGLQCTTASAAGFCQAGAAAGTDGGRCYGNGTCNSGLECNQVSGTCAPSTGTSSSGGGSSGSGGSSSGGGGGMTALQHFDNHVKAILAANCGACHQSNRSGPDFMGAGAANYYATITAYRSGKFIRFNPSQNSDLVLKGVHAGPAFTTSDGPPSQRTMVINWLTAEATERGLTGGTSSSSGGGGTSSGGGGTTGPALTASEAISWFGKCISPTDFNLVATGTNTKYSDVPNQNTTEGKCTACHTVGAGGAFLSINSQDLYDMTKITPYMLKLALPSQAANGQYTMVNANRFRDHGSETGNHPKYILSTAREAAVNQLFTRTLARYTANTGNCREVGSGEYIP